MKKIIFTVVFCLIALNANAATYWVSKSGSDGNSCFASDTEPTLATQSRLTIGAGADCLSAGDTLKIKVGTYAETLLNQFPSGTSINARTKIEGVTGETITIQSASGNILEFSSARDFLHFNNLILDGQGTASRGVRIHDTVAMDGMLFEHLEVKDFESTGFDVGDSVANSTFRYNTCHGIDVNGDSQSSAHCFYMRGINNIIEYNYIHNVAQYGINLNYNGGTASRPNIVRYNRITNTSFCNIAPGPCDLNRDAAISINEPDNLVHDNIIYSVTDHGILVQSAGHRAKVYHNTIYAAGHDGIHIKSGMQDVELRNNLIISSSDNAIDDLGTGTISTDNLTTGSPFINAAGNEFNLIEASAAIDYAAAISGFTAHNCIDDADEANASGACDAGALEAPVYSSSVVESGDTNTALITWLVASQGLRSGVGLQSCDFTDFALTDDGAGETETACTVTGTNRTDVDISGTFTASVTLTATYTRPASGALTDNVGIGCGRNEANCINGTVRSTGPKTMTNNVSGSPSVTWTSIHFRCLSYYSDTSPVATDWLRAEDASNSSADLRCPIRAGGVGAVAMGVQVTGANPDNTTFAWYANRNGGAYAAMTDAPSATALSFADALPITMTDSEISSAILTSPTNYFGGTVVWQQASSPTYDLAQNDDFQVILVVSIGSGAAVGDNFCIRGALSGQTETSITATQFPCFQVVQPAAGY